MNRSAARGFTLIELMITVAIIAILSAVAYPSYTQYIVRGNRSAAQSFVYTVANKQEAYLLNARTYFSVGAGDADDISFSAAGLTVPSEVSDNYSIVVSKDMAATPPTYTVTATPSGVQAARDTKCGALSLTKDGTKGESGTGTVDDCW